MNENPAKEKLFNLIPGYLLTLLEIYRWCLALKLNISYSMSGYKTNDEYFATSSSDVLLLIRHYRLFS